VKNPVRTNDVRWREHGASSIEKTIRFLCRLVPRVIWPFIPAQESAASWLFHVIGGAEAPLPNRYSCPFCPWPKWANFFAAIELLGKRAGWGGRFSRDEMADGINNGKSEGGMAFLEL
jgi:hypothetical protein